MPELVTKEQALTTLAQHFDDFLRISELLDPSHPNPAVKVYGQLSSRDRYFGAALAAVTGALSPTPESPVTFPEAVLVALMEYTSYYEVMSWLMKSGTGIRVHPEPDEHGLPKFTCDDKEQVQKTLKMLLKQA